MAVFWLVVLTPQLLSAQVPGRSGPCFEMWQVPNPNWKNERGPHPRQGESDVIMAGKSPGGYDCWFCIACGKEANEWHIASPGHDKQVCWYRSVHGASNLAGPASSSPSSSAGAPPVSFSSPPAAAAPVLAIADAAAAHAWTQPAASASASPLTVQLGTISIELSVDVALALRDALDRALPRHLRP